MVEPYESAVEKQIREAQERGEFDNLPGAGKPLRHLGDATDPDWWIKGLIDREQLDMTGALPPGIALRKEAATYPEALLELATERSVREVLEDYNRRARRSRLAVVTGPHPPVLAPTIDIEEMVGRWHDLRHGVPGQASGPTGDPPERRGQDRRGRRWFPRRRRRR